MMGWGLNQYDLVKIPVRKVCNGYYVRWYYNGWHYWFFQPGTYSTVTEGEKYRTIGTRRIVMGTGQVTTAQATGIRTIMFTREVSLYTIAGWMNIRIEPGSLNVKYGKLQWTEIELIAIIGSKEITYTSGFSPVNSIPEVLPSVSYCEVAIGTQIWMCKNFDSNYPGSKVYNNDEANRAIYGGLYTWDQIMSPGFCPVGWHIPTVDEWDELIDFVGDYTNAGGILKEIGFTYWITPNTGALNTFNFNLRGAGYYLTSFLGLNEISNLWTADEFDSTIAFFTQVGYAAGGIAFNSVNKNAMFGVRLIKDVSVPPITYGRWFLPSVDEWQLIYDNLYNVGKGNFNPAILAYWTSTEFNATDAYDYATIVGSEFNIPKGNTIAVRAARMFITSYSFNIGDTSPELGFIFNKVDNGNGTYTYYELAPTESTASQEWSNVVLALGTTSALVGEGINNTAKIIAQPGHIDSAAKECDDLNP